MNQSRTMSGVEAVANVCFGWGLALGMQALLFPIVGVQVTLAQNMLLSSAFTLVSLARSFLMRRAFNALAARG